MTELQRRTPGEIGLVLDARCASAPLAKKHELLALLAQMQRRGEIASAWTEGDGIEEGRYVVHYRPLREPRSKTPWIAAATASAIGAVVGVGALLYYSRWVLLAAAGGIVALTIIAVVVANLPGGEGGNHRCGRSSC